MVPCPSRGSPRPERYRAVTRMLYWVPGCRFFRRAALLSAFTANSFLGPPADGRYVRRYCRTFPGACSQETFMEETVSSKTLRSRGEPLAEKRGSGVRKQTTNKALSEEMCRYGLYLFKSL